MAIYLTHQYGQRFYGPEPDLPRFDQERFLAYSVDYRTIRITWDPPLGEFDGFRLVRNSWGIPQSETDGTVLVDSQVPPPNFDDTDVTPGRFAYYAIFLDIGGTWTPSGFTSSLHIADMGSGPWLWVRLPIHYRLLRGNHLTLDADENLDLQRYIASIGWGLDRVRTSMRASWYRYDTELAHEDLIDLLVAQFGLPNYPGLTGLRRRAIARDGAALTASKGTTQTLASIARATAGWNVELRPTRNMIGSYDRSRMHNPLPLPWDPSTRYQVGDRVHFFDVSYKCLVTAQGIEQMPDGEGATNTWWARLSVVEAATIANHSATASQHGWQGISHTVGQPDTKIQTRLALGIPRPGDVVVDTNAVTVHNTHSGALNAGARLLPVDPAIATPNPQTVITNAVPLPRTPQWSPDLVYKAGTVVKHRGQVWQAQRPPLLGVPPHTSDRWVANSTDDRLRVCLSAYTHQPHTDAAKAPVPATVYMDWYDDRGTYIGRATGDLPDMQVLDTFTTTGGYDGDAYISSERAAVTAGTNYRVHGRVFVNAPAGVTFKFGVEWYTAGDAYFAQNSVFYTPAADTWHEISENVTAPVGAAFARICFVMEVPDSGIVPVIYGDEWYIATAAAPTTPLTPGSGFESPSGLTTWYRERVFLDTAFDRPYTGSRSLRIIPLGPGNLSLTDRGTEYGFASWQNEVEGFIRDGYLDGVARPVNPAMRAMSTIENFEPDGAVAATFVTPPAAGMQQALILRHNAPNTYVRATRTALQTVNGVTVTTLATYSSSVVDGDRLTVKVVGNNYTVLRNGTQVATATSSFNNTATEFGIATEA